MKCTWGDEIWDSRNEERIEGEFGDYCCDECCDNHQLHLVYLGYETWLKMQYDEGMIE